MTSNWHTGRTALVTGGTRGIGRAIADRLRDDGARVIVTGTRPKVQQSETMDYLSVDFSEPESLGRFLDAVTRQPIDILVNNAGINVVSPFAEIGADDFQRIQTVNVTAPMMLMQAVTPGMTQRLWGRIINIGSIWGVISKAGRASYSASKFALDGLTTALAAEVAQHNVLVNCVAPGFIDTDLTRQVLGTQGMADMAKQVPAQRLGRPSEIASFVSWLVSSENTYISGQTLAIDGGFTRV